MKTPLLFCPSHYRDYDCRIRDGDGKIVAVFPQTNYTAPFSDSLHKTLGELVAAYNDLAALRAENTALTVACADALAYLNTICPTPQQAEIQAQLAAALGAKKS